MFMGLSRVAEIGPRDGDQAVKSEMWGRVHMQAGPPVRLASARVLQATQKLPTILPVVWLCSTQLCVHHCTRCSTSPANRIRVKAVTFTPVYSTVVHRGVTCVS